MNHIQVDNVDHSSRLKEVALAESARQIKALHKGVEASCNGAIEAINGAFDEALKVAAIVEEAHSILGGARFARWWDEQCLPVGWAKKYITLSKLKDRHHISDKYQLRLIGIIPEPLGGNKGEERKPANPFAWIKWTGRIRKSFEDIDIETMGDAEVEASLKHLEPIKDLIEKLEGAR